VVHIFALMVLFAVILAVVLFACQTSAMSKCGPNCEREYPWWPYLERWPDRVKKKPRLILVALGLLLTIYDSALDLVVVFGLYNPGSFFANVYARQGGDFDAFYAAAVTFLVLGILANIAALIAKLRGKRKRKKLLSPPKKTCRDYLELAVWFILPVIFEDIPQLYLKGIYLDTIGSTGSFESGSVQLATQATYISYANITVQSMLWLWETFFVSQPDAPQPAEQPTVVPHTQDPIGQPHDEPDRRRPQYAAGIPVHSQPHSSAWSSVV